MPWFCLLHMFCPASCPEPTGMGPHSLLRPQSTGWAFAFPGPCSVYPKNVSVCCGSDFTRVSPDGHPASCLLWWQELSAEHLLVARGGKGTAWVISCPPPVTFKLLKAALPSGGGERTDAIPITHWGPEARPSASPLARKSTKLWGWPQSTKCPAEHSLILRANCPCAGSWWVLRWTLWS